MLSIDVIPPKAHAYADAYADLGDAWIRYQLARIQQTNLQHGRHFRLDLNGLLRRLAIAARATRVTEALELGRPASADRTIHPSIDAFAHCGQVDASARASAVDSISV